MGDGVGDGVVGGGFGLKGGPATHPPWLVLWHCEQNSLTLYKAIPFLREASVILPGSLKKNPIRMGSPMSPKEVGSHRSSHPFVT